MGMQNSAVLPTKLAPINYKRKKKEKEKELIIVMIWLFFEE